MRKSALKKRVHQRGNLNIEHQAFEQSPVMFCQIGYERICFHLDLKMMGQSYRKTLNTYN